MPSRSSIRSLRRTLARCPTARFPKRSSAFLELRCSAPTRRATRRASQPKAAASSSAACPGFAPNSTAATPSRRTTAGSSASRMSPADLLAGCRRIQESVGRPHRGRHRRPRQPAHAQAVRPVGPAVRRFGRRELCRPAQESLLVGERALQQPLAYAASASSASSVAAASTTSATAPTRCRPAPTTSRPLTAPDYYLPASLGIRRIDWTQRRTAFDGSVQWKPADNFTLTLEGYLLAGKVARSRECRRHRRDDAGARHGGGQLHLRQSEQRAHRHHSRRARRASASSIWPMPATAETKDITKDFSANARWQVTPRFTVSADVSESSRARDLLSYTAFERSGSRWMSVSIFAATIPGSTTAEPTTPSSSSPTISGLRRWITSSTTTPSNGRSGRTPSISSKAIRS